jgi:hypothetical protein
MLFVVFGFRRLTDLHIGKTKLGDPFDELSFHFAETAFERFHNGAERINGDLGFVQLWRSEAEVKGSELEQAETVVGHNDAGGGLGELGPEFLKLFRRGFAWLRLRLTRRWLLVHRFFAIRRPKTHYWFLTYGHFE